MGTCASLHRDPESAVRFRLGTGPKGRKVFDGGKDEGVRNGGSAAVNGVDCDGKAADSQFAFAESDFGSKDEIFFESRAWIDSDCEDDFYSVKGDFTPSRGSTPVHPKSIPTTPQLNKTFIDIFPDTKSEPSPRKKLAQLLLETSADEKGGTKQVADEKVETNGDTHDRTTSTDQPPRSVDATPYRSGANSASSSERIPNGDLQNGKGKNGVTMQCCLPSVVHSFSAHEKKKKERPSTPEHCNGT